MPRLASVFSLPRLNHGVWSLRGYGLVTTLDIPSRVPVFKSCPRTEYLFHSLSFGGLNSFKNYQQGSYYDHKGGFPRQGTSIAGDLCDVPRCGDLDDLVFHSERLGSHSPLRTKD